MQKKLSHWATEDPAKRFTDLYSLLCHPTWLRVAHGHVNTNRGRETAGIDGETMRDFNRNLEANLEALRQQLTAHTFEPRPVRRVDIPKANGTTRPLGIPGIRDRIVQEALRMLLEPIWEADFSLHSYGFRPNRDTYSAIAYLWNRLKGQAGASYQWVIEGDITNYFSTIPHRRLIKAVKKRVADRDIRDLCWQFLRAGVLEHGEVKATLIGTPQGGIVSPLAANIYLDHLDKYMEATYLNLTPWARRARRKRGQGNYLYVRYADDFVVLGNGTKAEAQAVKEELGGFLETLGLTLSADKTKLTHITEGFDFLGYQIIRETGRRGIMVPKVRIPAPALTRVQHKVRALLAPQTTHESTTAKIRALNRLIRGWCHYYRCTSSPGYAFKKLQHVLYWEMAHWLGRKYKLSMPQVMRHYGKEHTFGTPSVTLVLPNEFAPKKLLVQTWSNPYTAPEGFTREHLLVPEALWHGHEGRQGWSDRREEVLLAKGTTCAHCATPLHPHEVEIDHIIPRARFKDPTEADRMKHLQPLCSSCHRAKTQSERQVLSRVR